MTSKKETSSRKPASSPRPVVHLVLPDARNPTLLARVRWPDVYQAMSEARPFWQADPGLFDLPHHPDRVTVSVDEATEIAAGWGVVLPSEDEGQVPGPALMRRMPSDWSHLSKAERHAWSIVPDGRPRRATPAVVAVPDTPVGVRDPAPVRRGWGRRRSRPAAAAVVLSLTENDASRPLVIDLTDHLEPATAAEPA